MSDVAARPVRSRRTGSPILALCIAGGFVTGTRVP